MIQNELKATIEQLTVKGKGILAADESLPTITKRFNTIHLEPTEQNRRDYREMLFTTEGLNKYISGVILYEETLTQLAKNGKPLGVILQERGIIPGIKVDKGLVTLANTDEKITEGLDGLSSRLATYKQQGARFAKWRAVYNISAHTPSKLATKTNAEGLARYAAICQNLGIVPIVEPEVLMDGDHSIERCATVTETVLAQVFKALRRHKVVLEHMLLKPSMVISGKDAPVRASTQEVANATLTVLRRTVPAAVPSINFLSGGQSAAEATAHLNAMNAKPLPWHLSFSYGRALQDTSLAVWQGRADHVLAAQYELQKRAHLNSAASLGHYSPQMENQGVETLT